MFFTRFGLDAAQIDLIDLMMCNVLSIYRTENDVLIPSDNQQNPISRRINLFV